MDRIEEKLVVTKTFQSQVLRRFMSEKEYQNFTQQYMNNCHNGKKEFRGIRMLKPLTPIEKKVIYAYLLTNESGASIIEKNGLRSDSNMRTVIVNSCLKLLYQNREKMGLEELLK